MLTKDTVGKYSSLYYYLNKSKSLKMLLTYEEIEKILNFRLPKSAYTYPAWWANSSTGHPVQSKAWMNTNYRVGSVLFGESVEFIRINANEETIKEPVINENVQAKAQLANSFDSYEKETLSLQAINNKISNLQMIFDDLLLFDSYLPGVALVLLPQAIEDKVFIIPY